MYQYYVEGGPAIVLKNFQQGTVGQQLGVANGTGGLFAGLGVSDEVWGCGVTSDEGWMLTLLERPKTVNVMPFLSAERIALARELNVSMDPSKLVLAIGPISGYQRKTKLVSVYAAEESYPNELLCNGEIPVECAWGNTDHKYQGRTIRNDMLLTPEELEASVRALRPEGERDCIVTAEELKTVGLAQLVVSLGQRSFKPPLTLRAVYVMLSRVVLGMQLRILPCEGGIGHLKEMRHEEELRLFARAFDDNGEGYFDVERLREAAVTLEAEGRAVAERKKQEKKPKKRGTRGGAAIKLTRPGKQLRPGAKAQTECTSGSKGGDKRKVADTGGVVEAALVRPGKQLRPGAKAQTECTSGSKGGDKRKAADTGGVVGAALVRVASNTAQRAQRQATALSELQSFPYNNNSCHVDTSMERLLGGLVHAARLPCAAHVLVDGRLLNRPHDVAEEHHRRSACAVRHNDRASLRWLECARSTRQAYFDDGARSGAQSVAQHLSLAARVA